MKRKVKCHHFVVSTLGLPLLIRTKRCKYKVKKGYLVLEMLSELKAE